MELGSERRTKGIKCVFVTCKVEGTGGLVKRRSTVEETEVKKRALGKILNQYSKHCNLELDDFTGEFDQTFKELIYILLKHFQKIK